ncbi:MAG: aminotransferase class I/II-fold pyridoxal phosphate-dependent enzyme [Deltaproteobacteria bacterium]|nr:aminotransferase class I/II-fold pyridoxal phosphate-dependent enzyme [Deltaproteobacteria bacterium]
MIDLRSDTMTLPSEGMRDAMRDAKLGDDVWQEDPTVRELEALSAERMGHEAGLFVPSGSMANLIAQLVHAGRGDEVICGWDSHCVRDEVGAGAALAGVQYEMIPGDGRYTVEQVAERIRPRTFHTPGTGLVWLENTHNLGGGTVFPLAEIRKIAAACRERDVPLHLDGARVFHAAVAEGVDVREIARCFTSMSFCLSKALGAPVGSVLCGSRDFRERALRFRKMLGGGMRQSGVLAAAGLYALRRNVERLAEDHANARRLAELLAGTRGVTVDPAAVQTNIVMIGVAGDAPELVRKLDARGVQGWPPDARRIRFVTHLGVDRAAIERAASIIREVLGA